MLLTQFTLKAKPLIGVVKVSEMLNIELYSLDILIKATVTGELELVDLFRKISHECRKDYNLINGISSYIYNINVNNSNIDFISKSKSLLTRFADHLYCIKFNGTSYRLAVEGFLLNVENEYKTFLSICLENFIGIVKQQTG